MKKAFFLSLIFLTVKSVNAQSIGSYQSNSLEFSFGIDKVGFIGGNDFVIDRIFCEDCDYQAIRQEGFELNFSLTANKTYNNKHELIYGAGFNLWLYQIDEINGSTGQLKDMESTTTGLIDLMLGYRYHLKEFKATSIFAENIFHGEVNTSDRFNKLRFSVAPGLGLMHLINDKTKLISVISYKQTLNNFSGLDHSQPKPYAFGIRFGLNKLL